MIRIKRLRLSTALASARVADSQNVRVPERKSARMRRCGTYRGNKLLRGEELRPVAVRQRGSGGGGAAREGDVRGQAPAQREHVAAELACARRWRAGAMTADSSGIIAESKQGD